MGYFAKRLSIDPRNIQRMLSPAELEKKHHTPSLWTQFGLCEYFDLPRLGPDIWERTAYLAYQSLYADAKPLRDWLGQPIGTAPILPEEFLYLACFVLFKRMTYPVPPDSDEARRAAISRVLARLPALAVTGTLAADRFAESDDVVRAVQAVYARLEQLKGAR